MSATIIDFPTQLATSVSEATVVPAPADAAERAAALNPAQSFLVEAPAGSGKTGLLVQRLLKLLCRVDRPESVLALTFTNKATAEMRERVLKALDLVPRDPGTLSDFDQTTRDLAANLLQHDRAHTWNLQQNSHRLNIRTIDSLCGEIARSLPLSSGAIGQMTPVEDAMPLYRRAARAVMLHLGGDNDVLNDALRTVLLHRDADLGDCEALLAQMLATREQWNRLIPLTPGELTDDFLDEKVKPRLDRTLESIVCSVLTSLERAFPADLLHELTSLASQLAQADGYNGSSNPFASCAALRTSPGTHHSDAEHWALLAKLLLNASNPYSWRKSMAVNHLGLVATAHQKKRLLSLIETLSTHDALHTQLCNLRNLPPSTMPPEDWRMTKALFQLLHFALLELHSIFRDTNVCDFTERSLAARAALSGTGSGQQRRARDGMDLEHLLVDEMQDTSSAQYELLEALTQGWDGSTRTVFLVGDPKQSIYLFRQARVERFLTSLASGELGEVPLTTLHLTTNFRSAAPLVRDFNQIFQPVFESPSSNGIPYTAAIASRTAEAGELCWHIDPLWGDHGTTDRSSSRLQVQREHAAHVVHTIHQLREDTRDKPVTFAVLVRAREHAVPITRLLRESGIPFRGVDLEPLDERPEVLDTLALTRALLHPADRVAWLAVLRAPWCGATLADLHQLAAGDERRSSTRAPRKLFRERAGALPRAAQTRIFRTLDALDAANAALGRMPLAELVERAARTLGTDLFRTDAERTNVRRFLEVLEQAEAELRPLDANDLQTRLARLYAEPDTTPGAVDIMTVHKAKGLEWDVVFVPELQRSAANNTQRLLDWLELPAATQGEGGVLLAPIPPRGTKAAELGCFVQTARRRQEHAELARLLYVVTTRARKQLHLYAAPALSKSTGEVSHPAGTLLATAWAAVGPLVQAEAERRQKTPVELELLQATAENDEANTRDVADLRRVPDNFDPSSLQKPLVLPWLHARSPEAHAPAPLAIGLPEAAPDALTPTAAERSQRLTLEAVQRPAGSITARALGTAVHLFLDQLAQRIAMDGNASPQSLLSTIETWPNRIRAMLRSMGTHGQALDRDTGAVLLALRNTLRSPAGLWLLQPHPRAVTEQALSVSGDTDAPARNLRLDRSFLAGPHPESSGTGTLWIVDYKTATPGDMPLHDFLARQRQHYAPQLRNYAQLAATQAGTPPCIMLALFYPMLPVLDTWCYDADQQNTPTVPS